ncbi:MAG: iron ABC transporter permease [Treponema sp.]|nr:iron ABC transporter permease [Treponema sp.]
MKNRNVLIFAAFGILLFAFIILNIGFGSSSISVTDIFRVFAGREGADSGNALIITRIRMPRTFAAIAGGAALAVAGFLLQTFFNNPVVDPYILGISSGSMFFVALVILGGWTFGFRRVTPALLVLAAFTGALLVMCVLLFVARRIKSVVTLLVIGVMTGFIAGGGTSILSSFAEKERIVNFSRWSMGSFAGLAWPQVRILYAIVIPFCAAALLMAKSLNALNMGESYAQSMGINVKLSRILIILFSSVLTAGTVAFTGPVSFIGLAVPHICRTLFHTTNSRILIPACLICGGLLALSCDFIARNIIAPVEIPLGAVTALGGAPLAVWLLTRGTGGKLNA